MKRFNLLLFLLLMTLNLYAQNDINSHLMFFELDNSLTSLKLKEKSNNVVIFKIGDHKDFTKEFSTIVTIS